jgi:uncharacterized membrane protein
MTDILRIILGTLLVLFLPGFSVSLAIFDELDMLERILLSIGLSISFLVVVAFGLGGVSMFREITGGYTYQNIYVLLGGVTALGLVLYLGRKWKR